MARVENQKTKRVRDEHGHVVGEQRWLAMDAGCDTWLEHASQDRRHPAVVANRAGEPATASFRLAGPLSGDAFARDDGTGRRDLPASTGVGDVIAFGYAGARGLEMSRPSSVEPRAGAYAVDHGEVIAIRRRQTDDDMIALDAGWRPGTGGA